MTYTYDPVMEIPDFLKREKGKTVSRIVKRRGSRKYLGQVGLRKRLKSTSVKGPKSWREADKVRVVVGAGWPASFPSGTRVCLVQRGKTNRSKFVRVREWPCYYKTTYKMPRDVFERSIVRENKDD